MKILLGLICIFATTLNVLTQHCYQRMEPAISLSVTIPQGVHNVIPGRFVNLEAHFDLAGLPFKSLKWFWKGKEFFSVTPKGIQGTPIPDIIEADISKSTREKVVLKLIAIVRSSGDYTCELVAGNQMVTTGNYMTTGLELMPNTVN